MSFPNALAPSDYELVIASATTQTLGPVGAKGDIIARLVIIPTSTSPGSVSLKDGAATAFQIFDGGATTLTELKPIVVELGLRSMSGAWQVTTTTNVRVLAIGRFT